MGCHPKRFQLYGLNKCANVPPLSSPPRSTCSPGTNGLGQPRCPCGFCWWTQTPAVSGSLSNLNSFRWRISEIYDYMQQIADAATRLVSPCAHDQLRNSVLIVKATKATNQPRKQPGVAWEIGPEFTGSSVSGQRSPEFQANTALLNRAIIKHCQISIPACVVCQISKSDPNVWCWRHATVIEHIARPN